MKIEVVEAGEPETPAKGVVLESPKIVSMVETSDNFWRRFNGELSFGVIYSKGNESTQYSLGSQTVYLRERWSAADQLHFHLSSSTGASASTRNSLDFNR